MCAEFTPGQPMEVEKLIAASLVIKKIINFDFQKRIFPGQMAPVFFQELDNSIAKIEFSMAEFSLIPEWWNPEKAEKKKKNGRPVFATHNARIESITEKPAFRKSFEKRHCIIPIYEFFESSLFGENFAGHRIKIKAETILLAAGCFNFWTHPQTGEIFNTFTILTRDPVQSIFNAGHDRMPIFLNGSESLVWLDNKFKSAQEAKNFLIEKSPRQDFEISVDRELKSGWEKNAPEPEEIKALSQRLAKV
jgi:putative SOS response-associated peptidase YedK